MLTDALRNKYELLLRDAFGVTLRAEADALIAALGNPPDVARIPAALWEQLGARLRTVLEPIIVRMAIESALASGAGMAATINWAAVNVRAAAWAERYTYQLVQGITATTRDMLRIEINRYFRDAGIDLKTLAANIQPDLGPLTTRLGQVIASDVRAEMVAITEVTRAAAEGEGALMAEIKALNPNVLMDEFFQTSADEIVCKQICVPLNGVRGDGRGNFVNPADGQSYRIPAHPRCRCARRLAIAMPAQLFPI